MKSCNVGVLHPFPLVIGYGYVICFHYAYDKENLGTRNRRAFVGKELPTKRLISHFLGSLFFWTSLDKGRPSNMCDFIDSLYL